jgi:hypothetical protein
LDEIVPVSDITRPESNFTQTTLPFRRGEFKTHAPPGSEERERQQQWNSHGRYSLSGIDPGAKALIHGRFPERTQLFGRNLDHSRRSLGPWDFTHEVAYMLWTIFVILLVMWLLGLVSSYTLGGYIHILLVIAVVVLVINLITGRRPAL